MPTDYSVMPTKVNLGPGPYISSVLIFSLKHYVKIVSLKLDLGFEP